MDKILEKILVIDDEPGMCRLLTTVLGDEGYVVATFTSSADALKAMKNAAFDLVITDVRMPEVDGVMVLEAVKTASPEIPVILITAHGTVESAVKAMKIGASDYIAKPFKNEEIRLVVARILEKQRLIKENMQLKAELASRFQFGKIVGRSSRMQDIFRLIGQIAQTDATVLIQGESGTGKELVARALHFNSPRSHKPFMVIHCGGLPENLLEAELFGHLRGAFTDAVKDRKGLLESADGGSVFLDEAGDMPHALQARLLRFLQDHEIRRLGSSETKKVDVRIIAATNKDLQTEIRLGNFRQDLFYRLSVVPILLPTLRERMEDVPLLAECFLKRIAERTGKEPLILSSEALQMLARHNWPGNVRELENAIEHAAAFSGSSQIVPDNLPPSLCGRSSQNDVSPWQELPYREAKQGVVDAFDKAYLCQLLKRAKGNITQAAEMAHMDRKNLYELLKKYGINPKEEIPSTIQ